MNMQGLAVIGSLLLAATPAAAQDAAKYPQKPIKIIVNVTPGGGIDSATRIVAQKVGERFGEPFVIENRAGGAGNIAAEAVYHSEPDGYTLLASPGATISMNDFLFKKLNYDPTKFEPVSVLTSVPLALIVRSDFPAKDFNEFVAYAKANPGKIQLRLERARRRRSPHQRTVHADDRHQDDPHRLQRHRPGAQ
jgi:tripartite-type tricarboxylate transporter receptor subunit TctC